MFHIIVLKHSSQFLYRPVGQLIVSAAVIDDMIALVILSLLEVFSGEFSLKGVLVPIFSSIGFLIGGGFLAIKVIPCKF